MATKKLIRIDVEEKIYLGGFIDKVIDQLLELKRKAINKNCDEKEIYIDVDYDNGYREYKLYGYREETDEELEKRLGKNKKISKARKITIEIKKKKNINYIKS